LQSLGARDNWYAASYRAGASPRLENRRFFDYGAAFCKSPFLLFIFPRRKKGAFREKHGFSFGTKLRRRAGNSFTEGSAVFE
jgi:hypothetical protein